jgi:hypothetical protein
VRECARLARSSGRTQAMAAFLQPSPKFELVLSSSGARVDVLGPRHYKEDQNQSRG